jgi:hypothetical protein
MLREAAFLLPKKGVVFGDVLARKLSNSLDGMLAIGTSF